MSFDYNAWKRAYLASERQRTAGESAAAAPAPRVAQRAADAMDDDVVEIVEVQNANGGLPHARADCATHIFSSSAHNLHCASCYCFVCDAPVAQCVAWAQHCDACASGPSAARWKAERARAAARRQAGLPPQAPAASLVSCTCEYCGQLGEFMQLDDARELYLDGSVPASSRDCVRRSASLAPAGTLLSVSTANALVVWKPASAATGRRMLRAPPPSYGGYGGYGGGRRHYYPSDSDEEYDCRGYHSDGYSDEEDFDSDEEPQTASLSVLHAPMPGLAPPGAAGSASGAGSCATCGFRTAERTCGVCGCMSATRPAGAAPTLAPREAVYELGTAPVVARFKLTMPADPRPAASTAAAAAASSSSCIGENWRGVGAAQGWRYDRERERTCVFEHAFGACTSHDVRLDRLLHTGHHNHFAATTGLKGVQLVAAEGADNVRAVERLEKLAREIKRMRTECDVGQVVCAIVHVRRIDGAAAAAGAAAAGDAVVVEASVGAALTEAAFSLRRSMGGGRKVRSWLEQRPGFDALFRALARPEGEGDDPLRDAVVRESETEWRAPTPPGAEPAPPTDKLPKNPAVGLRVLAAYRRPGGGYAGPRFAGRVARVHAPRHSHQSPHELDIEYDDADKALGEKIPVHLVRPEPAALPFAELASSAGDGAGGWSSTDVSLRGLAEALAREHAHCNHDVQRRALTLGGLMSEIENRGHAPAPQPAQLACSLREYQRSAVQWALDQERLPGGVNAHVWAKLPGGARRRCATPSFSADAARRSSACELWYSPMLRAFQRGAPALARGGLIAQEMGLGKTVVCLSLVALNPAPPLPCGSAADLTAAWGDLTSPGSVRAPRQPSRATLVVCNVSLVGQWVAEAREKLAPAEGGGTALSVYEYVELSSPGFS